MDPMSLEMDREAGLQFPLDWQGKILALATEPDVPARIGEALRAFGLAAEPTAGHTSARGRYVTYTVQVTIRDRPTLEQLTYALSRIPGVPYIL